MVIRCTGVVACGVGLRTQLKQNCPECNLLYRAPNQRPKAAVNNVWPSHDQSLDIGSSEESQLEISSQGITSAPVCQLEADRAVASKEAVLCAASQAISKAGLCFCQLEASMKLL